VDFWTLEFCRTEAWAILLLAFVHLFVHGARDAGKSISILPLSQRQKNMTASKIKMSPKRHGCSICQNWK